MKDSPPASKLIAPMLKRPIDDWTMEEVTQFIKTADDKLKEHAILFEQHVSLSPLFMIQ